MIGRYNYVTFTMLLVATLGIYSHTDMNIRVSKEFYKRQTNIFVSIFGRSEKGQTVAQQMHQSVYKARCIFRCTKLGPFFGVQILQTKLGSFFGVQNSVHFSVCKCDRGWDGEGKEMLIFFKI